MAIAQNRSIKTVDSEVEAALEQFERSLEYAPLYAPLGYRENAPDVIDGRDRMGNDYGDGS